MLLTLAKYYGILMSLILAYNIVVTVGSSSTMRRIISHGTVRTVAHCLLTTFAECIQVI